MSRLEIRNAAIPAEFAPDAPHAPTPGFVLVDLHVVGTRIVAVAEASDQPVAAATTDVLDAADHIVLPGFIDVHIHGADGHDTMDATPAALAAIAAFKAQHGVTGFLATTMTAPRADTLAAVANVAAVEGSPPPGAHILGVHLEGPFISPVFPGAQKAEDIRPPDLDELRALVDAGPVRMITLAPEQPGADAVIDWAREHGIVVVAGHTNATYDQCIAAVDRGVNQATHTYNAMTGLHHRKPGVVGAVLSDDRVYAQLIADTIHVHPAAMCVLARCKGPARTLLITDAMRAAGLPEGEYDLGGQPVTVKDGQCRLADGTLAGSVLTMDRALVNFMAASGWPLADAWPITSRTPAQSLDLGPEFGNIAPGAWADLVVLDADLSVAATIVRGRLAYARADGLAHAASSHPA
ncbi:MAG: N-acetylglucosamine-6-phosphate deacetylase [Caldilineaceae bacterium]|nr:N-acetylglucosamine-6-phosphate deacetylase [Caldilineaceae bacterium]